MLSCPYIYWSCLPSGPPYFKESVMWDTQQDFSHLNYASILLSLLKGQLFKGLLYWICVSVILIHQGTQPSCPYWEGGWSIQIVERWFLILETHTYFFLIEADNIKIQLNTFSEWRHFSGSELLHPTLYPGYYFFARLSWKDKEDMHHQWKIKSLTVFQVTTKRWEKHKKKYSQSNDQSAVHTDQLDIFQFQDIYSDYIKF